MAPSRFLLIAPLALLIVGCESGNPNSLMTTPAPHSIRLAQPDATYRLSPADRAKLIDFYDADALERLLQMVEPDARARMLPMFQRSDQRRGMITKLDDPALQGVLEEVWAPYWDDLPADALEDEEGGVPGREIARRRRLERQRQGGKPE